MATGRTVDEINQVLGADTLGYLSEEHVVQLAPQAKCGFCTGCFTGKYPVAPPPPEPEEVYNRPLSESEKGKTL